MKFKPDFLITPYIVFENKNLTSIDKNLYSVIYYFEKMRDGKCIASNRTLSEVCQTESIGSIKNSLNSLENEGFIKRVYKDNKKKIRSEIKCLVSFGGESSTDDYESSTDDTRESPTDDHISNNIINKNNKYIQTDNSPESKAKKFFNEDEEMIESVINYIVYKIKITEQEAKLEIKKFISYWTEPNKSGKKQRWEMEKTFEVGRRIATWFNNFNKYNKAGQQKMSGKNYD